MLDHQSQTGGILSLNIEKLKNNIMTIFAGSGDILFLYFIALAILKFTYLKDKTSLGFKIMIAGGLVFLFSYNIPPSLTSTYGLQLFESIISISRIIAFITITVGIAKHMIELFLEK